MDGSKRLKAQGGRERYARQLSSQMSKDDHSKLWGSSIEDAFPVKRKITLPKACGFEIEMARGLHGENKISGVLGDDIEIPISLDRSNNGI